MSTDGDALGEKRVGFLELFFDLDRRPSRLVVLSTMSAMMIAATAIPREYDQDG